MMNDHLAGRQSSLVRLAQYLAIADTRSPADALDLILPQCLLLLPNEAVSDAEGLAASLESLLSLKLHSPDVATSLSRLEKKRHLVRLPGGALAVEPALAARLQTQAATARKLQDEVRAEWLGSIAKEDSDPQPEVLWNALIGYLARVFRAHGLQALSLLVPPAAGVEESANPNVLLNDSVAAVVPAAQQAFARDAVTGFLADVPKNPRRAAFLSQVADGTFHLFAMSVAPEVTAALRSRLKPLTLFLDTNVLLALVGLQDGPQRETSIAVSQLAKEHGLPVKTRYHDQTRREMSNTIAHFRSVLGSRHWPQQLSRVACASGQVSGIELKYHQRNAKSTLLVDDFFAPADQWEVLAKESAIDVYRQDPTPERLARRATLEADYTAFLRRIGREDKRVEAIQHDMAVLEAVLSLQDSRGSALQSGAVLVTCDHALCGFDWERARMERRSRAVVLPSILWQALRPYLKRDEAAFDATFAVAFALPELNASHGSANAAASRMLSILAGYDGISEEAATNLLANRVLLETIGSSRSDEEMRAAIDNELVNANAQLLKERLGLVARAEASEAEWTIERRARDAAEEELRASRTAEAAIAREKARIEEELRIESQRRISAEGGEKKTSADLEAARKAARTLRGVVGGLVGVIAWAIFEAVVHLTPWLWLTTHSNSYGLQGAALLCSVGGFAGAAVKEWRKYAWSVVGLGALLVALQILGGPKK